MSALSKIGSYLGIPFGYGVYIHWPYCTQLCSYCNFNKYKTPSVLNYQQLEDTFLKELQRLLDIAHYPTVTSIYFGGGTPSLAPPDTIKTILNYIKSTITTSPELEVTLEINPCLDVLDKLNSFKEVGVNRFSIGIQTLNNEILLNMNRDHNRADSLQVLDKACTVLSSDSVNVDLMFGLPGQSIQECLNDLKVLLSDYQIGHMSLYQLTLERGTPLAKSVTKKDTNLPNMDLVTDMYFNGVKLLKEKGMVHYEVSNYAKSDQALSRHNLNYWLGGNYIGIGPGAHSRFINYDSSSCNPLHSSQNNTMNTWTSAINALTPQQWINQVHVKGHSMKAIKNITTRERFEEILVTSMRTRYGLSKIICESYNINYHQFIEKCHICYPELFLNQFLVTDCDALVPTEKGLAVMDAIVANLLHVHNYE